MMRAEHIHTYIPTTYYIAVHIQDPDEDPDNEG
jgi:hypothetical protein